MIKINHGYPVQKKNLILAVSYEKSQKMQGQTIHVDKNHGQTSQQ